MPRTNSNDPRRSRATFGVRYPDDILDLANKAEVDALKPEGTSVKCAVTSKKISITVSGRSLPATSFRECNFHTNSGRSATKITSITFEDSDFRRCIMGYVIFHRVTFKGCTFTECDFSRTEFSECTFENCSMSSCTAWHSIFTLTRVSPTLFINGCTAPLANYSDSGEADKTAILTQQREGHVNLAEQLLRSNEDRRALSYADDALYQLRKMRLEVGRHLLDGKTRLARTKGYAILAPSFLYCALTRGGTSLSRLSGVAAAVCTLIGALLCTDVLHANYQGHPSTSAAQALLSAVSLFFGFGFSNFSTSSSCSQLILVATSAIGVMWLALTLSVLVRRAYR